MIKKYACLDEKNIVIAIKDLDIAKFETHPGAFTYIEVDNGFRNIPEIGKKWDGDNSFI